MNKDNIVIVKFVKHYSDFASLYFNKKTVLQTFTENYCNYMLEYLFR